jgi:hypothetical protein
MNLYGWDTVYAVDIAVANRALAASASQLLHSLSQRVVGALGSYTVAATFGPWSIALGGDGQLIDLQATITHGSVTPDGHAAVPLDGYVAQFQLALRLLPPAAQQQKLVFDARRAGLVGDAPAPGLVVPLGFVGKKPDPSVAAIALNGLAAGLAAHADKISFAFATVNLVPPGVASWLAPKNLAYAFFNAPAANRSYLAILSTAGNAAALPKSIDPELIGSGAEAGFAISLPLYYANSLIPSLAGTLPGNPVGSFAATGDTPPQVKLTSPVGLNSIRAGAINYSPVMNAYVAVPGYNQLTIAASGVCDFGGHIWMDWSASGATNKFVFNSGQQTIGFTTGDAASMNYNTHIPWYYIFTGGLGYIAVNIAAPLISRTLSGGISNILGAGMLPVVAASSVHFAGMQAFTVNQAVFDGAIILIGHGSTSHASI